LCVSVFNLSCTHAFLIFVFLFIYLFVYLFIYLYFLFIFSIRIFPYAFYHPPSVIRHPQASGPSFTETRFKSRSNNGQINPHWTINTPILQETSKLYHILEPMIL